jgi:hypothetical protein
MQTILEQSGAYSCALEHFIVMEVSYRDTEKQLLTGRHEAHGDDTEKVPKEATAS